MTSAIKGDAATLPRLCRDAEMSTSPRSRACRWSRHEQGTDTLFDAKRLVDRKFPVVQADMKLWPFKVLCSGDKTMIQVQYVREERKFHSEEISSMVFAKMRETAKAYLDTRVKHAVANTSACISNSQRQTTKDVCYGSSMRER